MVRGFSGGALGQPVTELLDGLEVPPARRAARTHWRDLDRAARFTTCGNLIQIAKA
jgi:hypothetical protein